MKKNIAIALLATTLSIFSTLNANAQYSESDYEDIYKGASDYFEEAKQLIASGKNMDAMTQLDKAIEKEPSNIDYILKRAEIKSNLNNYSSANDDLNKILLQNPKSIDALHLQAKINFIERDFEVSDEAWNKIIAIDGSYEKYMERADYFENRGLYTQAIEDLDNAKKLAQAEHDAMPFDSDTESFRKNVLDKIDEKSDKIKQRKINSIE